VKKDTAPSDTMMIIVFGIGILLALIGIIAFFVPAVTRIIDIPGNERIKAIVAVIVGVIISYIGYVSLSSLHQPFFRV